MEQVARAAENGRYLRPFAKIILALAACRENQAALARKLLRELIELYPDSELFASEYAKVSSLPVSAAPVHNSASLLFTPPAADPAYRLTASFSKSRYYFGRQIRFS
jgi:hypothetical protein